MNREDRQAQEALLDVEGASPSTGASDGQARSGTCWQEEQPPLDTCPLPLPLATTRLATGPTPPPMPGDLFAGKYRLLRCLGEGGMGTVWAAHSVPLDTGVAIKVIRTGLTTAAMAHRLLNEARAEAKIRHPAIVQLLEFGATDEGVPYLVMELLEGESLHAHIVRHGRLAPRVAVPMLLPIAQALAAAHEQGIIHRDLKPENVFLASTSAGTQPKLLDFGIAKLSRAYDPGLTGAGAPLGSPAYMAPEQALGLEVDARADVWGFCIMLYEAIVGAPPFEAPTYAELAQRIAQAEAPTLAASGIAAPGLDAILQRGLAKRVEDRWESMPALASALSEWLGVQGIWADITGRTLMYSGTPPQIITSTDLESVKPPSVSRRPSAVVAAAALAALLLAGLVVGLVLRAVPAPPTALSSPVATPSPTVDPSEPARPAAATPTVTLEDPVPVLAASAIMAAPPAPERRRPGETGALARPTPSAVASSGSAAEAAPAESLDDIKTDF